MSEKAITEARQRWFVLCSLGGRFAVRTRNVSTFINSFIIQKLDTLIAANGYCFLRSMGIAIFSTNWLSLSLSYPLRYLPSLSLSPSLPPPTQTTRQPVVLIARNCILWWAYLRTTASPTAGCRRRRTCRASGPCSRGHSGRSSSSSSRVRSTSRSQVRWLHNRSSDNTKSLTQSLTQSLTHARFFRPHQVCARTWPQRFTGNANRVCKCDDE